MRIHQNSLRQNDSLKLAICGCFRPAENPGEGAQAQRKPQTEARILHSRDGWDLKGSGESLLHFRPEEGKGFL